MVSRAPDWQNVYETELRSTFYGIPLWNPQPSSSANRVNIGDVGYVYNGEFYRIFNVLKKDEKYCGSAKPLSISERDISAGDVPLEPVVSKGVRWHCPDTEKSNSRTYEFHVTANPRGAILIPLSGIKEQYLSESKESEWKKYMARNLDDWPEPEVCSRRDLLLVHTRIMVTEWIIMPFEMKGRPDDKLGEWSFKLEVPEKASTNQLKPEALQGAFSYPPEPRRGADIISMVNKNDDPAHCVFLRGYQPTKSRGVLGWKVENTLRREFPRPDTKYIVSAAEVVSTPSVRPTTSAAVDTTTSNGPLKRTFKAIVRDVVIKSRVAKFFQNDQQGIQGPTEHEPRGEGAV